MEQAGIEAVFVKIESLGLSAADLNQSVTDNLSRLVGL